MTKEQLVKAFKNGLIKLDRVDTNIEGNSLIVDCYYRWVNPVPFITLTITVDTEDLKYEQKESNHTDS